MSELHIITLDDYEVANLRELLRVIGYPWNESPPPPNPFHAANTGDWVGQIAQKLPPVDHWVCATASEMADRAKRYHSGEPEAGKDKPTGNVVCDICGATVANSHQAQHSVWHQRLTRRVTSASSGMGVLFTDRKPL